MKNNCIYVGGDFSESQMIWVLPIIKGINNRKLDYIIFEKNLGKENEKIIKKNFPFSKIFYLNRNQYSKYIFLFFSCLFSINSLLKFYLLLNRKKKITDWYLSQVIHSIWDSALSKMSDNQIKPNFKQILISIAESIISINNIKKVFKKFKIDFAVMGHTVYRHRATIAYLKKKKVKIFCQANYNIYKLDYNDSAWNQISNKFYLKIKKTIKKKKLLKYLSNRQKGLSEYEDANLASKLNNKLKEYPKNVILLHIFKDSPFNYIDKNKIFFDYFEWIYETLKIISTSKEKWSIRFHPNAKRWGESQTIILNNIISLFKFQNKNLTIDSNLVSNSFVFSNVKRVVTFSGTSHLEASCYGIKPIMISRSTLEKINKKFVIKPKNLSEYKKLIMLSSDNEIFKQKKKIILISKYLLFIRENILTLKKDLDGMYIYRGDCKKNHIIEMKKIKSKINKNLKFLTEVGLSLRNGYKHSISKFYFKKIK